jgi:hypothetical protein
MRFNVLRTIATAALLCATGAAATLPQTPGSGLLRIRADPSRRNAETGGISARATGAWRGTEGFVRERHGLV